MVLGYFLAQALGVRHVFLQLLPERRTVAHDFGVRKLMHEHVVDEPPRQLHQEQVERDVFVGAAAAPATFHLLDTDTAIGKAGALGQILQAPGQQLFGFFAEGADTGVLRGFLDMWVGCIERGWVEYLYLVLV